jgi:hypothetical protein
MPVKFIEIAATGLVLIALSSCGQDAAPTPSASPKPGSTRIRGTAEAVSPTMLTVQTYGGESVDVPLDNKTGYAWVVASNLSTLRNGDFIGSATSGPDTAMKALEVVIFPESMRGTGEGHYDWDVPGVLAGAGDRADVTNSMTNGTVTQSSMTNGTITQNAMTNGTVLKGAGKPGEAHLTVSYKGGTAQILVPAGTPIVRFEPTQKTVLTKGQKVFAVLSPTADGKPAARFVAIGKDGLKPPM